jgi:VWFA-related protein
LDRGSVLFAFLLAGCLSVAQEADRGENAAPMLKATSTYVWVPTFVKTQSGIPIRNLSAASFRLLDDGTPQKVDVVKTKDPPVSLVVLLQTGASAARYFPDYSELPVLISKILGVSKHETTLVTFDSKIEQIWHFPTQMDGVNYELRHLTRGDKGAAIIDAVHFGVSQLQAEPGEFRRVVLLVSQDTDSGSATSPNELLRQLGTASTEVHSIVFQGQKAKAKSRGSYDPCAGLTNAMGAYGTAIRLLERETASEISAVSGGDSVRFDSPGSFDAGLIEIGENVGESYTLGFQPSRSDTGFHSLRVEVAGPRSVYEVRARGAYWFDRNTQ